MKQRSKHSLSYYKLLTCDMGELIPCGMVEVLPGDTIQMATSALIRMSPLNAPVYHPCHVRVHHWFVPFRLLWSNWEAFITGGADGEDEHVIPTVALGAPPYSYTVAEGDLLDYLGVPPGWNGTINSLPLRAYQLIWNEFYRDQDLQAVSPIDKGDSDTTTPLTLRKVCWEKDYFTSARPWTQKGDDVVIPFGGDLPVTTDGNAIRIHNGTTARNLKGANADNHLYIDTNETGTPTYKFDAAPGLKVDVAGGTLTGVNALRQAFAFQRYKEARARYGSRYTEYLRYLGVKSSDARLQRPEYLGGGRQTIQFSEVVQTGVTTSGNAAGVGNLKGHGIGAIRSNRFRRFFEEHGLILSLFSVKPKTMYTQGMNRFWWKGFKEDFYQKELEHIGQQQIEQNELYPLSAGGGGPWVAYQDRYDEYRHGESGIAGQFRSTLNYWHLARAFSAIPVLNSTFVECTPDKRIFADQNADGLQVMVNHSIQARRIISQMGNPLAL